MNVILDVEKSFPSFNFSISYSSDASLTALLGPSGAGKSVFLRILAGIIRPDRGVVRIGDRVLFDSEKGIDIPPQKRRVGYLFQNYALFPTMNVYKNMTIALSGSSKKEKETLADKYATLLGIKHLLKRMPAMLSGGEKQRVALARLLMMDPDIILLDEPFSALDSALRENLRNEMRTLIEKSGKTAIIVTHDMEEAYYMSSYTYLLENGSVVEHGRNEILYFTPSTRRGASLLGIRNIKEVQDGLIRDWNIDLGHFKHPFLALRSDAFSPSSGEYHVDCRIRRIDEGIEKCHYVLVTEGGSEIYASFDRGVKVGERIFFDEKSLIGLSP